MKGQPWFRLAPSIYPKPSWAIEDDGEEEVEAELCKYCGRENPNPSRNFHHPFCTHNCKLSYQIDHI